MNLNELSKKVYQANKEKGFWDSDRKRPETLMLIVSELSEALEADRKGREANLEAHLYTLDKSPGFSNASFRGNIKNTFQDEIADTFIRLLDLVGREGIDIEQHIKLKLSYNATREHKHGKNY